MGDGKFWWGVAFGVGGVYVYHRFFKAIPSKKM